MKSINPNMTVVDLKAAAKAHGLKGYSRLRKDDLVKLLNKNQKMSEKSEPVKEYKEKPRTGEGLKNKKKNQSNTSNIIDASVPNIMDAPVPKVKAPILTPSAYVPVSFVHKVYDKTKMALNTFANWIMSYIPPIEPKKIVNEKLESLKAKVNSIFNKLKKKSLKFEKVNRLSKDFQNNIQLMELKVLILYHFSIRYNHILLVCWKKIECIKLILFLLVLWKKMI